jgi:hypothetical protein
MSVKDFKAIGLKTQRIIATGSDLPLIIYSSSIDSDGIGGVSDSNLATNVGNDTFLFVSGSKNSKDTSTRGVTLFGGDVVVSGTLYSESQVIEVDKSVEGDFTVNRLDGSDSINSLFSEGSTNLVGVHDQIDTGYSQGTTDINFYVSGSIGSKDGPTRGVSVFGGDVVISGSIYDDQGNLVIQNTQIGAAEDGSYTDGLFTDFAPTTPIGTAIDRINEVLKSLAPSPAPDLDQFDVNTSDGITAYLSFGSTQSVSGYTNVGTAAGYSAVDINGQYQPSTSVAGSYRKGIYNGSQDVIGDLNEDVSENVYDNLQVNYPDNSFNDAEKGTLQLFLNGSQIHSIDLTSASVGSGDPGSGTDSQVNGNGSGFINLSVTGSGKFSNGDEFTPFMHRTGQWKVDASEQVDGWNYAQVKHVVGSTTKETGYAEWVNDSNTTTITATATSLVPNLEGSRHISGVEYHLSGTATYNGTINNSYLNIYDLNNLTFTTTISNGTYSLSDQAKTSIDVSGGEDHTKTITIANAGTINTTKLLDGSISANVSVTHPFSSKNQSNIGPESETGFLLFNISDTASNTAEPFIREEYRVPSASYDTQASLSSANWDETESLVGSDGGHNSGLQVYNERLYYPTNTLNGGNFGGLTNAPAGNPDYSSATGVREYFRRFRNTTGNSVSNLSYTVTGNSTTLTNEGGSFSSSNIKIYFKLPDNGTDATGWMNAGDAFTYHNTDDGDGCYIGSLDTSITTSPSTNYVTFGTGSIANNEYVVMKILANSSYTGYLENFDVSFGVVGVVASAPEVQQIDANTSGVSGKLSFGSSLTLSGYTNVSLLGTDSAIDANGNYSVSGNRRGIFDGSTDITGEVNENTSGSGNAYSNNAFEEGHLGDLILEINGVDEHTIDLTTFGSGDSLNANGSGFTSVSAAIVGRDSSNLPDYTKFYRTASYKVDTLDQQNGFNYVRVKHDLGGGDVRETNYLQWVNDDDSSTITFSGNVNDVGGNVNYLSGIGYYTSPSGSFDLTATNIYKYVYSNSTSAVNFPTTTNSTITNISLSGDGVNSSSTSSTVSSLPSLNTTVSDAYDDDLIVSASFTFDQSTSLPNVNASGATLSCRINHPLKGNQTSSSTTTDDIMIFTISDNSTDTVEYFNGENKRLISGSYGSQSDITNVSNQWDSTESLDGTDSGHNNGLMIYNGELVAPSGDYQNSPGTLLAPTGNPDYTSVSNSTREYYRWFKNDSGSSKFGFDITLYGTATIVDNTTSLASTNRIQVYAKLPLTSVPSSTGFMDLATSFATGQTGDNDGCLVGTLNNSVSSGGTTNTATFGTEAILNNNYILIKIVADKTWSGDLSRMDITWS